MELGLRGSLPYCPVPGTSPACLCFSLYCSTAGEEEYGSSVKYVLPEIHPDI